MNSPEDDGLRRCFASLREEDQRAAPPFGRTAAAAALPRAGSAWKIALAATPILAIAVILAALRRHSTDAVPRELAGWSSPTAFLLETPGRQFLSQTPRLGEPLMHSIPAAQDRPK